MGAVGAILEILAVGFKLLDQHINDPARRLEARKSFEDKVREKAKEILSEEDMAKLDGLVLDLISTIHNDT